MLSNTEFSLKAWEILAAVYVLVQLLHFPVEGGKVLDCGSLLLILPYFRVGQSLPSTGGGARARRTGGLGPGETMMTRMMVGPQEALFHDANMAT